MTAVGCDVPGGLELQSGQGLIMEALPNFGLPATVETFNGGLKPGFPRRGKYRDNSQAQAEPDHPAHAIGKAVISLEAGVIVELSVSRNAKTTPVLAQSRNDFGGGDCLIRPACNQTSMERDGGQDDQRECHPQSSGLR